jgi:L-fuconolactonase
MSRVDAHHHLWDPTRRAYPWMDASWEIHRPFTTADLDTAAGPQGIGQTVVVQTVSSVAETEEFLAVAGAPGRVAGVVGWVDLTAPDVADALAALKAVTGGEALVAIRHQVHDEPDPDWLVRGEVLRGLGAVAKDLDLALRLAEQAGARMEQAATNRRVVGEAVAAGLGDHDLSALASFLRGATR